MSRPERFAAIFDRHAAHIQRYLARRLGQRVADDLVAETFLVAFGTPARHDRGRSDARPWLYGIATNLVRQHQREEVREYRLRASITPEPAQHGHADRVAAQVTAAAMNRLLAAALAELSVGDRDVLLLVAWEGLTTRGSPWRSRSPSAPFAPASAARGARAGVLGVATLDWPRRSIPIRRPTRRDVELPDGRGRCTGREEARDDAVRTQYVRRRRGRPRSS